MIRFVKKTLVGATAALILALFGMGQIQAGSVSLPDGAAEQAVAATASVELPAAADEGSEAKTAQGSDSADEHAAFGQCVADNAKTAPDNGGSDWNPTDGCENTNRAAGQAVAAEHASAQATAGLETASSARTNGEGRRPSR